MVRTADIEFESSLEAAARDFDVKGFVGGDRTMQTLRTRLIGRGLNDGEAHELCERLARAMVGQVGRDLATPLLPVLDLLMEVQQRVMRLYDNARQGSELPPTFESDMRLELAQRETFFSRLLEQERNHPTDPQNMPKVSLDAMRGMEESAGERGPGRVPEGAEEPAGIEPPAPERVYPRRPAQSRARDAALAQDISDIDRRAGIPTDIAFGWAQPRGGNAEATTAQFRGFYLDDPVFAGRGVEAQFRVPGEPNPISVDALPFTDASHTRFRLGEYKFANPEEGAESIYTNLEAASDAEGSFRDQIGRLMGLRRALREACAGILYRTNTRQSARALRLLIDSLVPEAEQEAVGIVVEGPDGPMTSEQARTMTEEPAE